MNVTGKFVFIFLFIFSCSFVSAQEVVSIKGYVYDKTDKSPLAYALITLEGKAIGTNTNEDGFFSITIIKDNNAAIKISVLGYKSVTIPASDFNNTAKLIYLETQSFNLNQVTVKPIDPLEVLKNSYKKIAENYPSDHIYMDAYYRELIQEDTVYIKMADAACTYYYTPYLKKFKNRDAKNKYWNSSVFAYTDGMILHEHWGLYPNPNDQVKIHEGRVSDNISKERINLYIVGGPMQMVASDVVKYKVMIEPSTKQYTYKYEQTIQYAGLTVYVISFVGKPKSVFKNIRGKYYIDSESGAFVSIHYDFDVNNCHSSVQRHKKFIMVIDYVKHNNKWYLNQVKKENVYAIKPDFTGVKTSSSDKEVIYKTKVQLFVNAVHTNNVLPFNESEITPMGYNYIMSDEVFPYNPSFWKNYNCKNCLTIEDKVFNDLQKKNSLEKQFGTIKTKNDTMPVPVAKVIPDKIIMHNDLQNDDYSWISKKQFKKDAVDYIKDENEYAANYILPLTKMQKKLFASMTIRSNDDVTSFPEKNENFLYYEKYNDDDEYPIYCRRADSIHAKEDTLINWNKIAGEQIYFNHEIATIGRNNKIIAYAIDTTGKEEYTCYFMNIATKTKYPEKIEKINSLEFSEDENSVLYTMIDSLKYSNKVYLHKLGTPVDNDKLLFEEINKKVTLTLNKSKSGDFIFLDVQYEDLSNEVYYWKSSQLNATPRKLVERINNTFQSIEYYNGKFYMLTNELAPNKKILIADTGNFDKIRWKVFVPHKTNHILHSFEIFKDFIAVLEQEDDKLHINIIDLKTGINKTITFDEEPTYVVSFGNNPEFETNKLIYKYSSFVTPQTIYEYDLLTDSRKILWQDSVRGIYYKKSYVQKRIWVTARDGKKIPVSLIYNRDMVKNGKNKLYLYA